MPKPKKPWRTVIHGPDKAGRFTREQVREAWREARMKIEAWERELAAMREAEGMKMRDDGGVVDDARTERQRESKMPKPKKKWREVIMWGDTGRFTRAEIDAAMDAVMTKQAARDARAKKAGRRSSSKTADAGGAGETPVRRSGGAPRAA